MQVETILSNKGNGQPGSLVINKNLIDSQSQNNGVVNLFESSDKYFVKDKLLIGMKGTESFESTYTKNNNVPCEGKPAEVQTNPLQISKEELDGMMNSITVKDFDKYEELGIIPEKEEPGKLLTVSERIKIELMIHCKDYKGSGLSVGFGDIEAYASNTGMAYAIAKKLEEHNLPVTDENIEQVQQAYGAARELKNVNEGIEGHLLKNGMEPSIHNVYLAAHSGAAKLNENSLTSEEWDKLKPQVIKMLQEVGMEESSGNLDNARWIIENNLPLTVDNLSLLNDIKNIELNLPDDRLLSGIASTMARGGQAKDTLFLDPQSITDRALEAVEVIAGAEDKQLALILQNDDQVTIENLKKKYLTETIGEIDIVNAKKQLEEIRLKMTLEAGVQMLNNGIKIEIKPLKDLIAELENIQQKYTEGIFAQEGYEPVKEDAGRLQTASEALGRLKGVPNYVIGQMVKKEIPFTIQDTLAAGEELKAKLDAASISYETLATAKRTDLGDGIAKAFDASMEGILNELQLERNESNERAVRILAYNRMEVTARNVFSIKQAAQEYGRLTEGLKPRVVAYLIANRVNPLNTEINQLNDYIDEIRGQIGEGKEEKYSEFLWKLDREEELTNSERDAYIGIYRLLNMIEKNDYAVIGSLIKQGAEVTLKNLASAVKTKKMENLDISIDKEIGERTDQGNVWSPNVIGQLSWFENRYYKQLAKSVLDNASPGKFKKIFSDTNTQEISLEKLNEELTLNKGQENKVINEGYQKQRINRMQEVRQINDETMEMLLGNGQKVSPENIMAAAYLMKNKKGLFEGLLEEFPLEELPKTEDALEDSESAKDTYARLEDGVLSSIEQKLETSDLQTLDLAKLKLIHSSVKLLTNMSKREYYHVPLEIEGKLCTVRLKIVSGSKESGKISVQLEDENLGKISSEFKVADNTLSGVILTDSRRTTDYIKGNMDSFSRELSIIGIETGKIDCSLSVSSTGSWSEQYKEDRPATKQLYQVAKGYIKIIKQWAEDIN